MTETQDEKSILYLHFGTPSPYWRLAADSDAIELSAVKGATNIAMALKPEQAQAIRALTGITASLRIDIVLYGDPIQLRLVGRKINPNEWAGTASAHSDTDSVARDLVEGLSFAETVVSEANSVIVIVDQHGRVQRFNKVSEEYTGKREQDIVGRSVFDMFMTREEAAASRRNIAEFYKRGQSYEVERLINTVKGPRLFLFRNKFVTSGSGEKRVYLICSGTDITEERQAQERLRVLANTDVLTNLPNRHAITTRLKTALAEGEGARGGVLFLDLDNFKRINDHHGHGFGDRLLKSVSVAISSCLAPGQTLARLGGDEFLVLQEHAEAWQLEATAGRIIERLREPFRQELIEVYTSCSIGIAMYPEHGDDLDSVVRSADIAMYVAKEAGRHTYRVFQPEMDRRNADSCLARHQPAQGPGRRPPDAVLPAQAGRARRRGRRGRGAAALAFARTRHDLPQRLHSLRGRVRPDLAAGRVGDARGRAPGRGMEARRAGPACRDQHVGAAAGRQGRGQ